MRGSRAPEIKGQNGALKMKSEVAAVSAKMDSLLGELAKARKVVSDFGELNAGKYKREEEMTMIQFIPPDSDHRKFVMDRMLSRLQTRVESEPRGDGCVNDEGAPGTQNTDTESGQ